MTATRQISERQWQKPRRRGAITSKMDGFRRAVRVYVCLSCTRWMPDGEKECARCQCKAQHFASTGEARRYMDLLNRQHMGLITELKLQPAFPVKVNGQKFCTYRADFQYRSAETGKLVIEDYKGNTKGQDTSSALRRKAAELYYGITIKIVEG